MIRLCLVFLIALIVTIIPLPEVLIQARPPWILLLILYIQFFLPQYFKLSWVFVLGIILDSMLSSVIGVHALSLSIVTGLASGKSRRFALFPIGQQMLFIGFYAMSYQALLVLVDSFLGYQTNGVSVIWIGLVSVLVWPWLRLLGEEFLRVGVRMRP